MLHCGRCRVAGDAARSVRVPVARPAHLIFYHQMGARSVRKRIALCVLSYLFGRVMLYRVFSRCITVQKRDARIMASLLSRFNTSFYIIAHV